MKRYTRYTCTTCRRQKDLLTDNVRAAPDRCTITLSCLGRLVPTEYLSSGDAAITPVEGVTDWYPRGTVLTGEVLDAEPEQVPTASGTLSQFVVAVKGGPQFAGEPNATLDLVFTARSASPKAFRQYTFRRTTTVAVISGIEDGLEKKVLRYTTTGVNPDVVEVYVNGVKQEEGVTFALYNGVPGPVAPNTVSFTPPLDLSGTTQIDVIVSKVVALPSSTLTLVRSTYDESRRGTGAWENVDAISIFDAGVSTTYYLFRADITSTSLPLNSVLDVTSAAVTITPTITSVPLTDVVILYALDPYTSRDRRLATITRASDLDPTVDSLRFGLVDDEVALTISATALTPTYPPCRPVLFTPATLLPISQGVEADLAFDSPTIIGPDA